MRNKPDNNRGFTLLPRGEAHLKRLLLYTHNIGSMKIKAKLFARLPVINRESQSERTFSGFVSALELKTYSRKYCFSIIFLTEKGYQLPRR